MRPASQHSLFWIGLACAALGVSAGAEAVPRTWRPMADWYRPELRITKLTARSVEQSELRFQGGDDPRWAAPGWDDSAWPVIERTQVPAKAGVFWLRLRVRTTGRAERVPAHLTVSGGLTAWECHWDGVLVGTQGNPGSSPATEIEGRAESNISLSAPLDAPGEHVVAIRASAFRSAREAGEFTRILLWTTPPDQYRELDRNMTLSRSMGVGAMLIAGIAGLVMWMLADRRLDLLLLSALCLSAALLVAVAGAPMLWDIPALRGAARIALRIGLVLVVSNLLVAVVAVHLFPALRRRWLALPAGAAAVIAIGGYRALEANALTPVLWRGAFAVALIVVAVAIWRRRQGAWLILAGVAGTYGLFERNPKNFEHADFLPGFLPALVSLIGAIALRLRAERLQARDAKLTAARLEIELLKKSLQPHFLMNTLTALAQVVEEKPAAAVRLIDDLAAEFRSLARFSSERQVSIADELALCRAHLGVMGARTDLPWKFEAEGIDAAATVPPALFLTLIENGFSHQRAERGATTFALRAEPLGRGIRYVFVSPGAVTVDTNHDGGGTGLRYVRARLEESFPGAWKLTQGAVAGGWETVIELGHPVEGGAKR